MAVMVNGERIDSARVEAEFQRLKPGYERYVRAQGGEPDEAQLRDWACQNIIEQVLLRQEADRLAAEGAGTAADAPGDPGGDGARVQKLLQRVTARVPLPTAPDVRAFYQSHRDEFAQPERLHASHIVKHDASPTNYAVLLNVREDLRRGGDFCALATRHSDCPERGGDLGVFARGQMVPEFDEVVFELGAGGVSEVFRTRFGIHVVKVHRRFPAAPLPLREVEERIRRQLLDERRQNAFAAFVDALKARAEIQAVFAAPGAGPHGNDANGAAGAAGGGRTESGAAAG